MRTDEFDYDLPAELIAQQPLPERSQSRMMVVDRTRGGIEHRYVSGLPDLLRAGDLLVVNDTRVIPARVYGTRADTGGRVEVLFLEPAGGTGAPRAHPPVAENAEGGTRNAQIPVAGSGIRDPQSAFALSSLTTPDEHSKAPADKSAIHLRQGSGGQVGDRQSDWWCLWRSSGRVRRGMRVLLAGGRAVGEAVEIAAGGKVLVRVAAEEGVAGFLEKEGLPPLPPYIRRPKERSPATALDRERYQTVYARDPGAVAAPTAGLHFTAELLETLTRRGVRRAAVTLHVGLGTFQPVDAARVEDHAMDAERYVVGAETAAAARETRARGGRVVAVGTTTVRALESTAREAGGVAAGSGRTSLFIFPPFAFRAVDILLTNFHLPRSTLLMLVSAFAGTDLIRRAYQEAIRERYRFYSYGDCMLIV